jgi:Spy/CpxP family protein refolding chaperone
MKSLLTLLAAALPALAAAADSPYAGERHRGIKALADDEVAALLAGAGLGYAKAAELNSHPGPMHALELADRLALSPAQRSQLADLMASHKAEARRLGAELVRLEAELDRLFAERVATPADVERKAAEIGAVQARLRASHLNTHIATTRLLTAQQVARYDELRGYRPAAGETPGAPAGTGTQPAHGAQHRHH